MLSPSVRDSNVLLAAYILPPLLAYVTKSWIVLPLKKRAKVKKVCLPLDVAKDSLCFPVPLCKQNPIK